MPQALTRPYAAARISAVRSKLSKGTINGTRHLVQSASVTANDRAWPARTTIEQEKGNDRRCSLGEMSL
jgi:hypothetical protein